MGAVLQADIGELQELGKSLATTAGAINGISVTATVTMPGSPIAGASEQGTRATVDAYKRIGENVNQMSAACESNAASYEDVDQAFRSQFQRYESGLGQ